MTGGNVALLAIAQDLGIHRYKGESDVSFYRRIVHSASRFWVGAFCADDGENGTAGVTKQTLNVRLKKWLRGMDDICPGILEWYGEDSSGISKVYEWLIDIGEISSNGYSSRYRAVRPHLDPVASCCSLLLGFYDASRVQRDVCGVSRNELVASGLATLVSVGSQKVIRPTKWWRNELPYMEWLPAGAYEGLRYADPSIAVWNIGRASLWSDVPIWVDELALVRIDDLMGKPTYYIARKRRHAVDLARITWVQAEELFFYLRFANGRKAVAHYAALDERHIQVVAPIVFLPGDYRRVLTAVSWPIESVKDYHGRIARIEALPLFEEMLEECFVGLGEVEDVSDLWR